MARASARAFETPTVAGMALVVLQPCATTLGADAVARFLEGGESGRAEDTR